MISLSNMLKKVEKGKPLTKRQSIDLIWHCMELESVVHTMEDELRELGWEPSDDDQEFESMDMDKDPNT